MHPGLLTRLARIFLGGALSLLAISACQAASPGPVLDPTQATGTAIVAAKATGQARMAATLTAHPTVTATPPPLPGAAPCLARDLAATAASEGATGAITIAISLTNRSGNPCNLIGPAQIALVDASGTPLDIQTIQGCFQCEPPGFDIGQPPTTQTAAIPTATALAAQLMSGTITLSPGSSAGLFLIWQNWCEPFPAGGVSVRLNLPGEGEELVIPSGAQTGGRCDAPSAPSSLVISQYQLH